jgi:hypothetical protein
MAAIRVCVLEGCDRTTTTTRLCCVHYSRLKRTGTTDKRRESIDILRELMALETDECIDWPAGQASRGYGALHLAGKKWRANRLACVLAHGPAPADRPHAAHSCGRPICVNPRHLRWASPAENSRDRLNHGTYLRGTRAPRNRLTEDDVRAVRKMIASGLTHREVAQRFGVHLGTVTSIINGSNWAWLDAIEDAA